MQLRHVGKIDERARAREPQPHRGQERLTAGKRLRLLETALKPGEIITQVSFPMVKRAAYVKFVNPASRYALVGVFVSEVAGAVRVAVTGAASCAFRVKSMEKALAAKFAPESIARIKVPAEDLNSDLQASAEYRSHLITVIAQRAVESALAGK